MILGLALSPIAGAERRSDSPGKAEKRVALPELDSYLTELPEAWRDRAKRIIERCETQSTYQIRVLELSYFPVVGSAETGLFLDPELTDTNASLEEMRAHVRRTSHHARWALELGSAYHALTNPKSNCSLEYDVVERREYLEALPVSDFEIPWNPGVFRPDYIWILERENICRLVDRLGIQETSIPSSIEERVCSDGSTDRDSSSLRATHQRTGALTSVSSRA